MKEIIAMHGWYGDNQIWKSWEKHFKLKRWIWQSADRGYGKNRPHQPHWINSSTESQQNKKVLICHSLGVHLIEKQILKEATDIVLINSFSSFIPNNKEARLIKTALLGMKRALGTSQEKKMLKNFLAKSFHPHPLNNITKRLISIDLSDSGRKTLQRDLEVLISTSGLPSGFPHTAKVLKITGDKDSIVSPSVTSLLSKDLRKYLEIQPTFWHISGEGHSIIKPAIIQDVRNWLEVIK